MKRTILSLTLAVAAGFCTLGCVIKASETSKRDTDSALSATPQNVMSASIVQLIATPESYNGKQVRVIGFVRLEFEGNAIYLHQDDMKHGISKNGLWLTVSDQIRNERRKYTDKYVLVEGTFNSQHKGHMGSFSGSIENIKRFEVWE